MEARYRHNMADAACLQGDILGIGKAVGIPQKQGFGKALGALGEGIFQLLKNCPAQMLGKKTDMTFLKLLTITLWMRGS